MNGADNDVRPGDTFYFTDCNDGGHLHIIIAGCAQADTVVVNITSKQRYSDTSCVIHESEHECLTHDTVIAWQYSMVMPVAHLNHMAYVGEIELKSRVSGDLLGKILDGAQRTRNLPLDCKALLESQSLI